MTDPDPRPAAGARADVTSVLLEQVRAGDREALETLFRRYLKPLTRWAAGRLPQHARSAADTQDLVQETLIQTLRTIRGFEARHEGALQAYLRQAVMNRIRDELRKAGRRGPQTAIDSQVPDGEASPLEQAIGVEAAERYERALARLRPEDREAIIARVEMECSYEDLARVLDKPTAEAARKAVQRALVRLAEEMKHGG
jgi:RNA polymerase sigma factor (sigma-70 family)